jgi:hypothetical protein
MYDLETASDVIRVILIGSAVVTAAVLIADGIRRLFGK